MNQGGTFLPRRNQRLTCRREDGAGSKGRKGVTESKNEEKKNRSSGPRTLRRAWLADSASHMNN
ncbi:uncharacterized protein GLRG_11382 [Colletotrichum graminicola M1.001]|uniref:Uncharacterized protein n=1 Tax=Colletotrichum graminicola (strain M1.001 / M2 / FGSC 10212) TaxID=645133 RepID=E3QZE9_COLGM|nr:uncharacterized protein GLRG_11382 [Colletotrichum graminicola M1.001]EFQ36237.1 hypothetical protein GLRG_11382 [Colletotrichum graminicola M1.001]